MTKPKPWVIAHRGAMQEAPENTLVAFQRAIDLGADLIELDVRQTADGHVVVLHDETLDRTTSGSGKINDITLADLQRLEAGAWFDAHFSGQRVPTLAEVLALSQGKVKLAIEIKAGSPHYPDIETKIVQHIQEANSVDDVIILAAEASTISKVRQLNQNLATACFSQGTPAHWYHYRQGGQRGPWLSDYLFAWPEDVSKAMVTEVHQHGLKIISSLERRTTLDPLEINHLVSTGIDGILTNDVRELIQILALS